MPKRHAGPKAAKGREAARVKLQEALGKGLVSIPEPDLAPSRDELLAWLAEDLGNRGDVTTQSVLTEPVAARCRLVAREDGVVAGLAEALLLAEIAGFSLTPERGEGQRVAAGTTVALASGDARQILAAERLLLNIVGRASGIATETRRLQDIVDAVNPRCHVAGTRKTTPGFRRVEKRAIAVGGGDPHRWGLSDALLVKDNHVAAVGSVTKAVARARAAMPDLEVECEADTVEQAVEAVMAGAHWVLLDNMTPLAAKEAAQAARAANGKVRIECSGGITEKALPLFAAFADRVSFGRLTSSARSLDVGLDWQG